MDNKYPDYPPAPNNFKYHSIDDLERFIEHLKKEIASLESATKRNTKQLLEEDRRMLHEAEYELLERTLLQKPNEDGASN